jgi:hypothetical protein
MEFSYKLLNNEAYEIVGIEGALTDGKITIPDVYLDLPVVGIGDSAFASRRDVTEVVMYDNIKYIGEKAFFNCSSLNKITLSCALKEIGKDAFSGADELKLNEYGNAHYLGDSFSAYSLLFKIKKTDDKGKPIKSITVHNDTLYIFTEAFSGAKELKTVKMGHVRVIGAGAFSDCENLKSISLGEVSIISANAFKNCKSLKTLILPKTVEQIKPSVFLGCDALKSVCFKRVDNWRVFYGAIIRLDSASIVKPKEVVSLIAKKYKTASWFNSDLKDDELKEIILKKY